MTLPRVINVVIALAAAPLATYASSVAGNVKLNLADVDTEYDYIIVGGGTSGLVVANRLTEDPNSTSSRQQTEYKTDYSRSLGPGDRIWRD
jgi:hypothetical protein